MKQIHGCGQAMKAITVRHEGRDGSIYLLPGFRCPSHPDDEYVQDYVWEQVDAIEQGAQGLIATECRQEYEFSPGRSLGFKAFCYTGTLPRAVEWQVQVGMPSASDSHTVSTAG